MVEDATKHELRVELNPGRREHEVHMALEFVAPELYHTAKIELTDDFVRLDQCVHVGLQSVLCVHGLLVELYFYETVGVRADDKVNLSPVDHDDFLDIVDDIGKLLGCESLDTAVLLGGAEVAMEYFLIVEPFCTKQVFFSRFIRVIVYEVWNDIVFLLFFWQEAVVILPMILVHSEQEWSFVRAELFALPFLPFILFVF